MEDAAGISKEEKLDGRRQQSKKIADDKRRL